MAPLRRKGRRNLGGAGKAGMMKKPAPGGRGGPPRDLSSRSSSRSSGSRSRSSDEDESSSCDSDSDEDHPDDYKKGGYHPVMPYQLYNGRFRVLSKLGAGAFSTVWLCTDEKESSEQLVAMKVCKSKKSVTEQAEDEVALFERLQEGDSRSAHCTEMRGHFWHSGPNGRHKCMVFEVMGENLLALVKYYDYRGLPINIVRRLARHTLIGLEYIHSRGIIHTDVKLENVLVQRHDYSELLREASRAHRIFTEQKSGAEGMSKSQKKRMKKKQKGTEVAEVKGEEAAKPVEALSKSQKKRLKQKQKNGETKGDAGCDSETEEPACLAAAAVAIGDKTNDGEGDDSDDDDRAAAEACGRPVPPVRQKERFSTLTSPQVFAKLADFGNGCRVDKKVTDDIQTRQYRSPEVIFGAPWDETADIWSAACMFFELMTGDFLFDPRTGENWSRNEDHLALITELIGDCPRKDFLLSGRHSKEFYTNGGKLKHIKSLKYWSLQQVLAEKYKWSDEEAEEVADFLNPMLEWQPINRCSATKALKHFWVQAMPGELDTPDLEKLNTSHHNSSTEADTPPSEARKGKAEKPAEAAAGDVEEADTTQNREAAVEVPERAEAEVVTLSSPREAPEAATPAAAAPEPAEASVVKEDAGKAAAPSDVQATAEEPAPVQPSESVEADTTQDVEEVPEPVAEQAAAPVVEEAQVVEAAEPVEATEAADVAGARHEDFVDLNTLDLADSMPLVAALEPSDCDDMARLSLEPGCECKQLDSSHIIVLIRESGASAVVRAAEIARKARGVSQWMSLEDYKTKLAKEADGEGCDDKPKKKKNNKKKGKK